jgi:endogenous inhibitor of DNA gyrase (YacG/DUF329 family)
MSKKIEKYKCPVCKGQLVWVEGSRMRPDGITMFCPHKECPAQEVGGYGRNEESAFQIIQEKYIV